MAFEGLKIDDITPAHINALVGAQEGRSLDFKQESYGRSEAENRKFRYDITAFANTVGGHIVIGVTEAGGAATGIPGITLDPDEERTRLESIALTGIEPRLIGLQIRAVQMGNGTAAIVIEIPRSWNGPHRVTAQDVNRFYLRAGVRNYEPDVDELRMLFTAPSTMSQRMRDFRHERVARIVASDTPVLASPRPPLILHIFPFSAFNTPSRLAAAALSGAQLSFMPMVTLGTSFRINLDGLVLHTVPVPALSYTMVWKNGCLEATAHNLIHEHQGQLTCPASILTSIYRHGFRYLNALRGLGIEPPLAFFITLTGTKGVILTRSDVHYADDNAFDRDPLPITEVILEKFPDSQVELQTLLKPAFDEIANAAGYETAPTFNANGNVITT